MSTALLTDRYELTMLDAALDASVTDGIAERRAVFEVFARRLPAGRRYGVVAGQGRLHDLLAELSWGPPELAAVEGVVGPQARAWLAGRRLSLAVSGYAEGEVYGPGSPVLTVEGAFGEALLLETLTLSVLNHDSAVASAAARMVAAAGGRPLLEMGGRRTHEQAAVAAARAAYVAGFAATSNLEAGRRHGVPTVGTSAHAFTLAHASEEAAFRAQVARLGAGTTLLVDTFDTLAGIRTAVAVAGPGLGAVRLDSGDPGPTSRAARALLDELGATGTQVVVTGDLDEHAIAGLADAPVDRYGVGTALVTGSGAPTAGFVYKLVAIEGDDGRMRPVSKRSPGKATAGGRKWARRVLTGEADPTVADRLSTAGPGGPGRALQVPLAPPDLHAARERCRASLAELGPAALDLSPGQPLLVAEAVDA